jgi:hypothetical protein
MSAGSAVIARSDCHSVMSPTKAAAAHGEPSLLR